LQYSEQFRNISLTDPYRATVLRGVPISYLDSSITELDAIQPPLPLSLPGEYFPRANYTEEIREVIIPSVPAARYTDINNKYRIRSLAYPHCLRFTEFLQQFMIYLSEFN